MLLCTQYTYCAVKTRLAPYKALTPITALTNRVNVTVAVISAGTLHKVYDKREVSKNEMGTEWGRISLVQNSRNFGNIFNPPIAGTSGSHVKQEPD